MTETPSERPGPGTGVLLIVAAVALVIASVAEFAPGELRGDGDNPADSVAYLNAAFEFYGYSGGSLIAGGATLIAAVVGVALLVRAGGLSHAYLVACCFGVLAGGFFAVAGVLRLNATGTVLHISGLDESWGESAYLAVQMAGTQGLLATGMLALSGWLVATAVLTARRRLGGLLVIGLLPAAIILLLAFDILAPRAELPDVVFLTYIAAITIGLPGGLLALGVTLLVPAARARLGRVGYGDSDRA
jgi:hypothetical protein